MNWESGDDLIQDAAVYNERCGAIKELYDTDKYLQAYRLGETYWGPYQQWPGLDARLWASRILRQLGSTRASRAIDYVTWRRHPDSDAAAYHYASCLASRRGPLQAWDWMCAHEPEFQGSNTDYAAGWLGLKAYLLTCFRDFEAADIAIKQALDISKVTWVWCQAASILSSKDQHLEALALLKPLYPGRPNRVVVLSLVDTYLALGEADTALELLRNEYLKIDSVQLCMRLLDLLINRKLWAEAEQVLERTRSLIVFWPKNLKRSIDAWQADVDCGLGNYQAAAELLKDQDHFFAKTLRENLLARNENSTIKLLEVPMIYQKHMTCAPASLAALSQYFGVEADHEKIAEEICYGGTRDIAEYEWGLTQGFCAFEFDLQWPVAKQLLDQALPFALATQDGNDGHMQVICGYDENRGTYLIMDPSYHTLREMLTKQAETYYQHCGPRCLLLLPPGKKSLLDGIELPVTELHKLDHAFHKALEVHQVSEAELQCEQMRALDRSHRLTLHAQRSLAIYRNNEVDVLAKTEALLALDKNVPYLQHSRVSSLLALARREEALMYMRELTKDAETHISTIMRLADELRHDHRCHQETEKLLKRVLNARPNDAYALYVYAGFVWGKRDFETGTRLYRWALCVDDKDEHYASCFFKASRFIREEQDALVFLQQRYKHYGHKASGPAQSLYLAYSLLEREDEGLKVLHDAHRQRPEDIELVSYFADKQIYHGRVDACEQLLNDYRSKLDPYAFYRLHAKLAEKHGRPQEAINYWRQAHQLRPYDRGCGDALLRLWDELGEEQEKQDYLAQAFDRYGETRSLLWLAADWLEDIDERCKYFLRLIEKYPNELDAHLGLVEVYLNKQEFVEARHIAQQALSINPNSAPATAMFANCLLRQQKSTEADEYARKALAIDVDNERAISVLMQAAVEPAEKREALAFLRQQISNQVCFGDAILEYQEYAADWLSSDDLAGFANESMQERPDLWQAWVVNIQNLLARNLLEEARSTAQTACENFALLPRMWWELADVAFLQKDSDAAVAALKQAINLNPGYSGAVRRLADIYEALGDYQAQAALLSKALVHAPKSAGLYGYLANAQFVLGDQASAIGNICKAIDLDLSYDWAWQKLGEWSSDENAAKKYAAEITQSKPHLAAAWQRLAILEENSEGKEACFKKAFEINPRQTDLHTDYVSYLVSQQSFTAARAWCDHQIWQQKPPISIRNLAAWVEAKAGARAKALDMMRQILLEHPNYANGWRLAAQWYERLGQNEAALEATHRRLMLIPHDPDVLCWAAEKYLELGDTETKSKALPLLQKAFSLRPSDHYIGLTYLDSLLEDDQLDQANEALESFKRHHTTAYIQVREIQLAVKRGEKERALSVWWTFLETDDDNRWLFKSAYFALNKPGYQESAFSGLAKLLDAESGNPQWGYLYATHRIQTGKIKRLEEEMPYVLSKGQRGVEACDTYLRQLVRDDKLSPKSLVKKLYEQLQADPDLWGMVAYMYFNKSTDYWPEVVDWVKPRWQRDDAGAWVLFHFNVALREGGDWSLARKVIQRALTLPEDNYLQNIQFWYLVDETLSDKIPDGQALASFSSDELTNLESYLHSLMSAVSALGDRSLNLAMPEVEPWLRKAQQQYSDLGRLDNTYHVRRRIRRMLERAITGNWWQKTYWKWKLGNCF